VSQDAFNRWNDQMQRRGKAIQVYIVDCNRGQNSYFVNSQQEVVYYRPQTITASRRFARRSPLADYEFTRRTVRTTAVPLPKEQPA
jgi:maleate cis-trans isomerase